MSELLSEVLEAHGGLERWRGLREFRGHLKGGGLLFERKGFPHAFTDTNVGGRCHEQEARLSPFLAPGQHSLVRPAHAAIRNEAGETLLERSDPRAAFPADPTKPWDELNLAYFSGYALWNYLTAPFLFTLPGVETQELEPVKHDGESLRRLLVRYPETVMTHSRDQTFYISERGLIVRMDYAAEVTGRVPAANIASEHREVAGGLIMPTRRTVVPIGPDGTLNKGIVFVSLKLDTLEYV